MKYTHKKLPGSQIELEVSLEQQEFLNYYKPIYDQELSGVHLKGFRPGTAPKELAEKAVDKEKVFEKAVNNAVRENLQEINQENNWQLVAQPKIEILPGLDSQSSLRQGGESTLGLKYKVVLTIFPEVKLGNYKKISRDILKEKKEIIITDTELKDSINWVLNSRAKTTRVNRGARNGDLVDMEFSGFLDSKKLDRLSGKNDQFILGQGKFVSGFEENVLNHKEGDDWKFSVTFPKDYWDKELQDKQVEFQVRLKSVFERELPQLTDEFVKGLGNFSNVEDLKKNMRSGLEQEKGEKEKERLRLKILEAISKNAEVDIPQIMIDKTLDSMVAEYQQPSLGKNQDQIRQQLNENAKTSVKNNLILYRIAKEEKLEPNPKEIEEESNKFLAHSQFSRQSKIDPQRLSDYIYGIIQNKKVFEYLESL